MSSSSPSSWTSTVSPSTTRVTYAAALAGGSSPRSSSSQGRSSTKAASRSSRTLPHPPDLISAGAPLRRAAHVRKQRLFDLLDDRDRLVPLALPDVAAEDDAGAARLHHVAGVGEDRVVIGLGAAGEDDEGTPSRLDALADRLGLVDLHLVVRRGGVLVLARVGLRHVELDHVSAHLHRHPGG